jgi:hypothetical protein
MRTTPPNVTISPITLHLDADEDAYDEYPKVGIVARAQVTVKGSPVAIDLESAGVWGIECPDLIAGWPIPEGSWVISDFGNDQIDEVRAAIRALLPDNPTPTTPTAQE